jgi:hypothetical protein
MYNPYSYPPYCTMAPAYPPAPQPPPQIVYTQQLPPPPPPMPAPATTPAPAPAPTPQIVAPAAPAAVPAVVHYSAPATAGFQQQQPAPVPQAQQQPIPLLKPTAREITAQTRSHQARTTIPLQASRRPHSATPRKGTELPSCISREEDGTDLQDQITRRDGTENHAMAGATSNTEGIIGGDPPELKLA